MLLDCWIPDHNTERDPDISAELMREAAVNGSTESQLQPLKYEHLVHRPTNCQKEAWLDFAAYGFLGGRFEREMLAVQVFFPFASANRSPLTTMYRRHEGERSDRNRNNE